MTKILSSTAFEPRFFPVRNHHFTIGGVLYPVMEYSPIVAKLLDATGVDYRIDGEGNVVPPTNFRKFKEEDEKILMKVIDNFPGLRIHKVLVVEKGNVLRSQNPSEVGCGFAISTCNLKITEINEGIYRCIKEEGGKEYKLEYKLIEKTVACLSYDWTFFLTPILEPSQEVIKKMYPGEVTWEEYQTGKR